MISFDVFFVCVKDRVISVVLLQGISNGDVYFCILFSFVFLCIQLLEFKVLCYDWLGYCGECVLVYFRKNKVIDLIIFIVKDYNYCCLGKLYRLFYDLVEYYLNYLL